MSDQYIAPRLFGRQWNSWSQVQIQRVLAYFQRSRAGLNRISMFERLRQTVINRRIDESAISASELMRIICLDDGLYCQPLIGTKNPVSELNVLAFAGNGTQSRRQGLLEAENRTTKRVCNLTDYWPRVPVRECEICGTELLRTVNTPWRRITSDCAHCSTICLVCLQQHTQNQLAMHDSTDISCPLCPAVLSPDDVKAWNSPAIHARYERLSLQKVVIDGLSVRWCGAQGCRNGFLCDPEQSSYVTCDACRRTTCLRCDVEYHSGVSCEDYQRQKAAYEKDKLVSRKRIKQERRSKAEISRISVVCPGKKCGAPIQKASGCDHMTCVLIFVLMRVYQADEKQARDAKLRSATCVGLLGGTSSPVAIISMHRAALIIDRDRVKVSIPRIGTPARMRSSGPTVCSERAIPDWGSGEVEFPGEPIDRIHGALERREFTVY